MEEINKRDINKLLYQSKYLTDEEKIKVLFDIIENLSLKGWNDYFLKKIDLTNNRIEIKTIEKMNTLIMGFELIKTNYLTKLVNKELIPLKNNTSEWLTVKDVCSILRISRVTLYKYRKQNLIKTYMIRGKTMFKNADVKALVNQKHLF